MFCNRRARRARMGPALVIVFVFLLCRAPWGGGRLAFTAESYAAKSGFGARDAGLAAFAGSGFLFSEQPEPLPKATRQRGNAPITTAPAAVVPALDHLPAPELLHRSITCALISGTPEQKERALEFIRIMRSVAFVHEVIEAIDDPTPLPRHGDTGWGFVGHQAATTMGELAFQLDRIPIERRGRRAYSFFDDMYKGGAALQKSGRLGEVHGNWTDWWTKRQK